MLKKDHQIISEIFITLIFFILPGKSGAADDIRFQHLSINESLSQSRISDIIQDEIEEVMFNGMPLGAMKSFDYQVREQEMDRGDTVLLISDGLPELKNGSGVMFDYSRVKSALQKSPDGHLRIL